MDKPNIFNNILSYENNVSSMIVNLTNYDLFKKELLVFLDLELLNYKDVEVYTEVDLRVEKDKKTFGRIDIMIIDNDNNEYLVENKITNYRDLTKNQVDQYVEYIKVAENAKKLIFLLPKNYAHLKTIQSMKDNDKNKIVEIKYWQNFVKHFKQSGIYELNQFIREFIDFLEDWFVPSQVKFSYDEIKIITNKKDVIMNDAKIATIMKKLIEIVEDVNIIKAPRKKPTDYGGYGYAINNSKYNIDDDLFIWYGIDYDLWEELGYPLMIWINNSSIAEIKKILNDNEFEDYKYDNEEEALIFLFKNFKDVNLKDTIEEKIVQIIEKLKKIKKAD